MQSDNGDISGTEEGDWASITTSQTQQHHINAIQEEEEEEEEEQQQQKTIANLQQEIQRLAIDHQQQANTTREQLKEEINEVHNSLIENLQLVVANIKYDLNVQLIEKLTDLAIGNGNVFQSHLDAVREYLDQKFDSHAPIAGMENIDKTALIVDKEEETAAETKEDDLVAEEAKERAQTMTVKEDTATVEIPLLLCPDEEKDKAEIGKASITISHNFSRNDQSTKRLQRYTSQQPRAKAITAASIMTFITSKYKNATYPRSAKLKQLLRITEGKEEWPPVTAYRTECTELRERWRSKPES